MKKNKKAKKMSNKKLSSRMAFGIVGVLSLLLLAFAYSGLKSIEKVSENIGAVKMGKSSKVACSAHAFKGEATVRAWLDGGSDMVAISKDDLASLPGSVSNGKSLKVKMVDMNEETRNRLEKANSQSPESIKITGFATKCGELNLASLG
jgi:hypothetical protein